MTNALKDSEMEVQTRRGTLKTLGFGVLFALGGIVAALALIEVVFRLLPSRQTLWKDRPRHYFYPEGASTLQDFNHSAVKTPGTIRIAVIGDSFTFGPYLQFDDAFPKRLERWLNLNQQQPKVEVINYGVPRYSTYHEVPVVMRAIEEGADFILMQITLNDPEIKHTWPAGLIPDEFGQLPAEWKLLHYWRSLAFVVQRIKNRRSQIEYQRYFFRLYERHRTWNRFVESWKTIASLTKEKNIPIGGVIFPLFGMTVNDTYPFFPIDQKVEALLDSVAIPHLDITEEFRDIPVDRLQVLPEFDRHPNEIGHRIAAEAILRWLPSLHALPDAIFPKGKVNQRIGITIENRGVHGR